MEGRKRKKTKTKCKKEKKKYLHLLTVSNHKQVQVKGHCSSTQPYGANSETWFTEMFR